MHRRCRKNSLSILAVSALTFFFAWHAEARHTQHHHYRHHGRLAARHHRSGRHVIQCVAFVKQASDIKIRGNARDWWDRAEGRYARGSMPEPGSVLSFRGTRRMPLGHVALVRSIVDSRTIYIDQSHWASSGISRNVRVVDVSPDNDWSAVRVALRGNSDRLGSIYPTNGFIYGRPEEEKNTARVMMVKRDSYSPSHRETASAPMDDVFDSDAPNRSIR